MLILKVLLFLFYLAGLTMADRGVMQKKGTWKLTSFFCFYWKKITFVHHLFLLSQVLPWLLLQLSAYLVKLEATSDARIRHKIKPLLLLDPSLKWIPLLLLILFIHLQKFIWKGVHIQCMKVLRCKTIWHWLYLLIWFSTWVGACIYYSISWELLFLTFVFL